MTDQTTHITPKLALGRDEYYDVAIIHDGKKVPANVFGMDPDVAVKEVFRILTAMTYTRKDYSDGSVGYWAFFRDGDEFWTGSDTLEEVVDRVAGFISMYLTGRNGYPLFDGILDLDAVK